MSGEVTAHRHRRLRLAQAGDVDANYTAVLGAACSYVSRSQCQRGRHVGGVRRLTGAEMSGCPMRMFDSLRAALSFVRHSASWQCGSLWATTVMGGLCVTTGCPAPYEAPSSVPGRSSISSSSTIAAMSSSSAASTLAPPAEMTCPQDASAAAPSGSGWFCKAPHGNNLRFCDRSELRCEKSRRPQEPACRKEETASCLRWWGGTICFSDRRTCCRQWHRVRRDEQEAGRPEFGGGCAELN